MASVLGNASTSKRPRRHRYALLRSARFQLACMYGYSGSPKSEFNTHAVRLVYLWRTGATTLRSLADIVSDIRAETLPGNADKPNEVRGIPPFYNT